MTADLSGGKCRRHRSATARRKGIGLLLVCRDVSERKRIEAERLAIAKRKYRLRSAKAARFFKKRPSVHRQGGSTLKIFLSPYINKEQHTVRRGVLGGHSTTDAAPPIQPGKRASATIFSAPGNRCCSARRLRQAEGRRATGTGGDQLAILAGRAIENLQGNHRRTGGAGL